jgi:hypothetical protein
LWHGLLPFLSEGIIAICQPNVGIALTALIALPIPRMGYIGFTDMNSGI